MEKTLDREVAGVRYASLTPEQREELRKRASELVREAEFLQATEILKNSAPAKFDKSKFAGEISWLAALAVAVSAIPLL